MPFDDLNLEFEDEEEALKKKKAETLQVDVDLEFQAPDPASKPRPAARPAPQGAEPAARPAPPSSPGAQVRKIEDARAASPGTPRPAPRPVPAQSPAAREGTAPRQIPTPMVSGSSALETAYDFESESVVQMREEMRRVQIESEVKVGVAEFKTEFLSEMLSDMKLLDHQINQLLVRINAKHPDMKQEVLMIKKLLADFNAKKRK